jgi:hypothetical protein
MSSGALHVHLNRSTLRNVILKRAGFRVCLIGALLVLAGVATSIAVGGRATIEFLTDDSTGFMYKGGRNSAGTTWLFIEGILGLSAFAVRPTRPEWEVLRRYRRLQEVRLERGRKTVRRAAGKLAADKSIPIDQEITFRALRKWRGCPTLVQLATGKSRWRLRRSDHGWEYVD